MDVLKLHVEEFTTPVAISVNEDTTLSDMNELVKQQGIRHLPVIKNGEVIGIISDRDLKFITGLSMHITYIVRASDIMIKNPVTVRSSDFLDVVAFEMSDKKIGSVIVNDENDNFYGIFTVTDALNALIEIIRTAKIEDRSERIAHVGS